MIKIVIHLQLFQINFNVITMADNIVRWNDGVHDLIFIDLITNSSFKHLISSNIISQVICVLSAKCLSINNTFL